jgi:hypothetical protein
LEPSRCSEIHCELTVPRSACGPPRCNDATSAITAPTTANPTTIHTALTRDPLSDDRGSGPTAAVALTTRRTQPSDVPHLPARFAAPVRGRVRLRAGRHDPRRTAERTRRRRRRRLLIRPRRLHALAASGASAALAVSGRPALMNSCTRWRRNILRLRSFWNRARSPLRRDMYHYFRFVVSGCGRVRRHSNAGGLRAETGCSIPDRRRTCPLS